MKSLKDLLDKGVLEIAKLPAMNDFEFSSLDSIQAYTVPLIAHDYGAKTPLMWNSLYRGLGLNLRNIMVVGNPEDSRKILDSLRQDPKYLGGGLELVLKNLS